MSDSRKTAVINNELLRVHAHIAVLEETRLAGSAILRERDFISSGRKRFQRRPEYGVDFSFRKTLLGMTGPSERVTNREILTEYLHTADGPVCLIGSTLFPLPLPLLAQASLNAAKSAQARHTRSS